MSEERYKMAMHAIIEVSKMSHPRTTDLAAIIRIAELALEGVGSEQPLPQPPHAGDTQ